VPFSQPVDALRRAVDGLAAAWASLGGSTPARVPGAQPALV